MLKVQLRPILSLAFSVVARGQQLQLGEADLHAYDGADSSKPIYLAINGTIYDVSASPNFYGPGGSYHHFAGRDASRAWVTECWNTQDQLTWRMNDVEKIFMPRYLDEELEKVKAGGELDLNVEGVIPVETIALLAEKALERLGKVTEEEKAERRKEDVAQAEKKVHETLSHWVDFFDKSNKYSKVGSVVYNEDAPAPPALCNTAMQKRPIKGGRLDALMDVASMGRKLGVDTEGAGVPDFVKPQPIKDEL